MRLREVIKHEGDKWILYSSDGKKRLGEFDSEAEAQKRERQIQFFKHQGEARKPVAALVEKLRHTAAWHRCWEKVRQNYDDRAAAAICTWSVQRGPNPPDVYKGTPASASAQPAPGDGQPVREALVELTIDQAYDLDDVLAAEMELRGIKLLMINTDDWSIAEVADAGQSQNPEEPYPAEYTPEQEAARAALAGRGLLEVGSRHTQREHQLIERSINFVCEVHGVSNLDELLSAMHEANGVANLADYLEATIHRAFTVEADLMLADGVIDREERIFLSHCIGLGLDAFSQEVDAQKPDLRSRPINQQGPFVTRESVALLETLPRSLTEATLDEAGNLRGAVVVEGKSANNNVYTREALASAPGVFAGLPIYADHPTRTEEVDRPERSVRDLVGRLPESPDDFYIEESGGRGVLRFKNGRLSETANWLATLIREGIAGAMSINATGSGHPDEAGSFVVETFTGATSLDFVTRAAAGGRGELVESNAGQTQQSTVDMDLLTVARLAEARPDIIDTIAQRERQKAYGEKQELQRLKEANTMAQSQLSRAKARIQALEKRVQEEARGKRKIEAEKLVGELLSESGLPGQAQTRVKRLIEADVARFVEVNVPTIKLPADVEALPDEAKALWMERYFAALPEGEEPAMHKAWAALSDAGWKKDDKGSWSGPQAADTGELPPPDMAMGAGSTPGESAPAVTAESIRKAIGAAILQEREYLASISGAGNVTGMGGGDNSTPPQNQEALEESFARMGLSQEQAKIAAQGRARR